MQVRNIHVRSHRHLNKLQVVGLAKMQIASAGPDGAITEQGLSKYQVYGLSYTLQLTCFEMVGIRDLDLSCNLLKNWQAVADIARQLPHLKILRLK